MSMTGAGMTTGVTLAAPSISRRRRANDRPRDAHPEHARARSATRLRPLRRRVWSAPRRRARACKIKGLPTAQAARGETMARTSPGPPPAMPGPDDPDLATATTTPAGAPARGRPRAPRPRRPTPVTPPARATTGGSSCGRREWGDGVQRCGSTRWSVEAHGGRYSRHALAIKALLARRHRRRAARARRERHAAPRRPPRAGRDRARHRGHQPHLRRERARPVLRAGLCRGARPHVPARALAPSGDRHRRRAARRARGRARPGQPPLRVPRRHGRRARALPSARPRDRRGVRRRRNARVPRCGATPRSSPSS